MPKIIFFGASVIELRILVQFAVLQYRFDGNADKFEFFFWKYLNNGAPWRVGMYFNNVENWNLYKSFYTDQPVRMYRYWDIFKKKNSNLPIWPIESILQDHKLS